MYTSDIWTQALVTEGETNLSYDGLIPAHIPY